MITSSKKLVSNSIFQGDWAFLPTAFSAMAGVGIGLLIGSYLGWI
jgi:hypothetical protein